MRSETTGQVFVEPREFAIERERKRLAALRRRDRYRRRLAAGETVRIIAAEEGISTQAVYMVLRREGLL